MHSSNVIQESIQLRGMEMLRRLSLISHVKNCEHIQACDENMMQVGHETGGIIQVSQEID